uniref:AAA+ ATPase domain-containing protein n=1 Tax=Lophosiphonia teges TaxID=2007110 RepID=A0A1Z1MVI1_9FLOR|nr:hypothetical protein [Polysiphonia teges]
MLIADDLNNLLDILPEFIKHPLERHPEKKFLIEIVMDLGRRPEARFPSGPEYLSEISISWNDLDFCIKKVPQFSGDNRSGIECTLHRISSIKNRKGNIIGLTFRVGRAIFGTISHIRDILYTGKSILLLGKPGVGKTTAIREITRILADEMEKRVVIIDTSNEIAGDGDIPHPAIGRARRMQVARPELQHQVMIEAVENHMPEVIIIDEIGTELESLAARTIAERGVQLVGTAHGNCLHSVIKNPTLCDLIGGIQYVTLGDDEAKRRGSQKSIVERKAVPAFQVAIEINERSNWIVHERVDTVVDKILQGSLLSLQRRKFNSDGSVYIGCEHSSSSEFVTYSNDITKNKIDVVQSKFLNWKNYSINQDLLKSKHSVVDDFDTISSKLAVSSNQDLNNSRLTKVYVYGINIQQVEVTILKLKFPVILTRDILKADYILGLRRSIKHGSKIRQFAKSKKIAIYTIQNNNVANIIRALKQILNNSKVFNSNWHRLCLNRNQNELSCLFEARYAIEKVVIPCKQSAQLLPCNNALRKLQSRLINVYDLKFSLVGDVNSQRLTIYP